MTTAVVICGHGTRVPEGAAQFVALTERVARALAPVPVTHAFMELSRPSLPERLEELYAKGFRSILTVPGMLLAAGHVKTDIPALLREWSEARPDVRLSYGRALGLVPPMLNAVRDRIEAALRSSPLDVSSAATTLLVIGRGSSDPDANAEAAKLARLMWEGMGFAWGEIGYFAVTFPTVDAALERAARQGSRRVIVAPFLLFDGVLARDLDERVRVAARARPDVEFIVSPRLNDHEGVVATLVERIREGLSEQAASGNCALCKYRAPVLAFDRDVGGPQFSDDDPRHVPAVHPFADHPMGPGEG